MSRQSHTILILVATSALTVGLAAGAGQASADPPAKDNRCTIALAQAAHWPSGGVPGHRWFSDAYESHLLQQPACDHHS